MTFPPLTEDRANEFLGELRALRAGVDARRGPEDVRHLAKIERWGRLATLVGYATAWLGVNPVSVLGIALGISTRWAIVAHHVLHGGYDASKTAPPRYRSRVFASGWRRLVDWCDWLEPRAWQREHNGLHHHRLGEIEDPDVPERNFALLRRLPLPVPLKAIVFLLAGATWKWTYYGPNVVVQTSPERRNGPLPFSLLASYVVSPFDPLGRRVWARSWLPYAAARFGLFPLPFLALGPHAWKAALVNSLLAEIVTNLHSFLIIVTNHAGSDLPRFDTPPSGEAEHALRQIVGSVNFRTGGDLNDFLHGWLNYQIEHHVWPNLSLRQYQLVQPELKALCARYGVPYRQESVWRRFAMLFESAVRPVPMWHASRLVSPAR